MTKMILSLIMISMSMFMFFLNHPLSMGLMILFQTLLTCMISGMLIKTYWFSYIMFLTFLGGLLVLFIYVSSIASNEMFKISFNLKMTLFIMILMSSFMSIIFMFNLKWMNLFPYNMDMMNLFNNFLFINNENKMNLTKLYNSQTFMMMMMMIIYLFITLIATVKITNIFYGPIRSSN
uniref:NADH-ubiquinone oxidoreductase chain 6 n=1 Tax=Pseudonoorda nigropunctalis TaxID=2844950 RepID=A0A8F1B7X4_9NEOP|nr:NADH dehydrogenase subunit 6 [Pseudonoorda nigropunctalis]QWM93972.1 NADH dehydrogenase subunit 6 [Pseudonoorda nigropunctalis]